MNKILPIILVVVLSGCSSEMAYIENCADDKFYEKNKGIFTEHRIKYYEKVIGRLEQYCSLIGKQPDIKNLVMKKDNPHTAVHINFLNEKNRVFKKELQFDNVNSIEFEFLDSTRRNFYIINNELNCLIDMDKGIGNIKKYYNLRPGNKSIFSSIEYEANQQIRAYLKNPVEKKIRSSHYEKNFQSCEIEEAKAPKLFEIKWKK